MFVISKSVTLSKTSRSGISGVTVAGGAYLNFTLKPEVWNSLLPLVLRERDRYGDSALGRDQ